MRHYKRTLELFLAAELLVGLLGCRTLPHEDSEAKQKSAATDSSSGVSASSLTSGAETQAGNLPVIPTLGIPTLGDISPKPTAVLVFLGGYTSCKDPLQGFRSLDQTRAAKLMQAARATIISRGYSAPAFLISCQFNDQNNFIYRISSSPRVTRQSGIVDLIKTLNALTATLQSPDVYLVGHSYGGWAAMKLALALPAPVKVSALIGVDAISARNCLPMQFLDSLLKRPVPGCTEAPSDVTAQERVTLAQRVRTWINLYQLDSRLLHSGAIANATNTMRRYPGRGLLAHGDIFDDTDLNTQILGLLPR